MHSADPEKMKNALMIELGLAVKDSPFKRIQSLVKHAPGAGTQRKK